MTSRGLAVLAIGDNALIRDHAHGNLDGAEAVIDFQENSGRGREGPIAMLWT